MCDVLRCSGPTASLLCNSSLRMDPQQAWPVCSEGKILTMRGKRRRRRAIAGKNNMKMGAVKKKGDAADERGKRKRRRDNEIRKCTVSSGTLPFGPFLHLFGALGHQDWISSNWNFLESITRTWFITLTQSGVIVIAYPRKYDEKIDRILRTVRLVYKAAS